MCAHEVSGEVCSTMEPVRELKARLDTALEPELEPAAAAAAAAASALVAAALLLLSLISVESIESWKKSERKGVESRVRNATDQKTQLSCVRALEGKRQTTKQQWQSIHNYL